ncbi:hypothetical protein Psi02_72280 [Planotetraspora silvatica]|uniref:Peptidase C39-like domain-containing protein n=1 Tax=Planotetraspora silvatica TaxID=234614 RepID=A0A8J3UYK5_9ACTN|nr:hypothetical protein [Planotetraspora silvatica]GII50804.1 hypothetical protein Psi02_72280 [Planotetraspora silvatica]
MGDPARSEGWWHQQARPDTCGIVTQEFVLDELTGVDHTEAELTEVAMRNGWYQPGGGTPMTDVGNLLQAYGMPVDRTYGATFGDPEAALCRGDAMTAGVDSSDIWHTDDPAGQENIADHAVEVIGIDYSTPDGPEVVLNDPGARTAPASTSPGQSSRRCGPPRTTTWVVAGDHFSW